MKWRKADRRVQLPQLKRTIVEQTRMSRARTAPFEPPSGQIYTTVRGSSLVGRLSPRFLITRPYPFLPLTLPLFPETAFFRFFAIFPCFFALFASRKLFLPFLFIHFSFLFPSQPHSPSAHSSLAIPSTWSCHAPC